MLHVAYFTYNCVSETVNTPSIAMDRLGPFITIYFVFFKFVVNLLTIHQFCTSFNFIFIFYDCKHGCM